MKVTEASLPRCKHYNGCRRTWQGEAGRAGVPLVLYFLSQLHEGDIVVVGRTVEFLVVDGVDDPVLLAIGFDGEAADVVTDHHLQVVDAHPDREGDSRQRKLVRYEAESTCVRQEVLSVIGCKGKYVWIM